MASAWQKDRTNSRGQVRSTVYVRDRDSGETVTDWAYPKKIATERAYAEITIKVTRVVLSAEVGK